METNHCSMFIIIIVIIGLLLAIEEDKH